MVAMPGVAVRGGGVAGAAGVLGLGLGLGRGVVVRGRRRCGSGAVRGLTVRGVKVFERCGVAVRGFKVFGLVWTVLLRGDLRVEDGISIPSRWSVAKDIPTGVVVVRCGGRSRMGQYFI